MKKLTAIVLGLALVFTLAACGNNGGKDSGSKDKLTKLKVGASPVPHAEILEKAKPILKKKGIDLEIVKFQDYVTPNKALASGEIDANYFQTLPYLKLQEKKFGYDFAVAGKIHIEPIGIYSKKYKSLKDLPKGATIIMSNSVSDQPRMLLLLQEAGLIKLKKGVGYNATKDDIVKNPKHIKIKDDYDPGMLSRIYKNGEGDAVLINTNYALDAGLKPKKDAIALESSDSPYANLIVVNKKDKDNKAVKKLVDVLQSKEIQDFINKKYKGAVVPVKPNK
ncbi:D-methionine transport system substrate-binding protein [Scopulibacillus darangshiensis]|uniref:Lipoprotein n=1 Tax=Scopulibacillus darangshiensis TaxID=442528 RepID=A0A4R2NP46_9BACL|nr:MetQ/NlpA family ABC transporter substrate-binding protein [Scopulibacillus darangshiensis]TCP23510.1 D-methionine transport system substrate-binding protein [Scopulibacillus darangshiensis]